MALTEEHTTLLALPAIFDMQQFMSLEVLTCIERSITHVARKGILVATLVLSEICMFCEKLSTMFTDKGLWFFMQLFVSDKLRWSGEALVALLTLIPTCWFKYRFQKQSGNHFVYIWESCW